MKKIIGIDIDDCMCSTLDMDLASALFYANKHNINLPKNADETTDFYVPRAFNFTKEQEMDYFLKEKKFIMKHCAMYPKIFAKEVINKLKKKNFKIIFITSRDNIFWNGNSYKYAKKWLKKYGIKYDRIFASVKDKSNLCKELNLDYMIEDNPEFVEKLNNNDVKTILIKTPYNKNYSNKNNIFAYDWLHLYTILGKIYNFDTNDIIFDN